MEEPQWEVSEILDSNHPSGWQVGEAAVASTINQPPVTKLIVTVTDMEGNIIRSFASTPPGKGINC